MKCSIRLNKLFNNKALYTLSTTANGTQNFISKPVSRVPRDEYIKCNISVNNMILRQNVHITPQPLTLLNNISHLFAI